MAAGLALIAALLLTPAAQAAEESLKPGHEAGHGADWRSLKAANEVANSASLQRGARNYVNYCLGCHSLKYQRYERMARDLGIPSDQLRTNLIPPGAKPTDYMMSSFPSADGVTWFGRAPPDLSLITRSKGPDYVFQFLKTFYVDDSKPTHSNNLALDGAAMPAVLSDLEGVKRAVFSTAASGDHAGVKSLESFEQVSPGQLTAGDYDAFVRDLVNFLDYVGDPTQLERQGVGLWVVLFLMVFTRFAWMLKREYWKDVH